MYSFPPFSMPSVQPGQFHPAALDGPAQGVVHHDHAHRLTRVAVGGRVLEHELSQREPVADEVRTARGVK